MPHDFHVVKRGSGIDMLHRRFERQELRASINFLYGPYSHMGIRHLPVPPQASAEGPLQTPRSASLNLVGPSDPPVDPMYCLASPTHCSDGIMQAVGSVASSQDVARWVAMVFADVENGGQGEYEEYLLSRTEDRAETRCAAAMAFGPDDFNFIVEVVGDDWDDVARRVRDLTETPLVRGRAICVTTGEHTRGFGSEASKLP